MFQNRNTTTDAKDPAYTQEFVDLTSTTHDRYKEQNIRTLWYMLCMYLGTGLDDNIHYTEN
jgi:hypothetical protein